MTRQVISFNEHQAVQLLLVRAVEEQQPELVPPELSSGAALAALHTETAAQLLERRAAYLFDHLPKSLKMLERISLLPEIWTLPIILATLLVGTASNYLGPSGQVHVVYNPIVILLLWNFLVYGALLWTKSRSTVWPRENRSPSSTDAKQPPSHTGDVELPHVPGPMSWLIHVLFRDFYCWWHCWRARVRDTTEIWKSASYFSVAYSKVAGPLLATRLKYLLHLAAIGMAAGAVAGIYLRGFFFDYHAVWKSTFVHDAGTIETILNSVLGLASLVFDGRFLHAADIQPLLRSDGAPAAPWIHRLAVMVLAVVIVPRTFLLILSARRARAAADYIEFDLADPYYVRTIETARQDTIHRIRDEVATLIRLEIAKLAEATGIFVREKLFDKRVAPSLVIFRNNGGRVADLESEITKQGERFEAELNTYLEHGETVFQQALATGINAILGRERSVVPKAPDLDIRDSAGRVGNQLAGSMASNLSDFIGAAMAAAAAAAIGTISGGIGNTLGIAIISTLIGTSGPIGLLIGGIGALAVTAGAYLLGRERVTTAVKHWTVPPPLAKIALRDSKLEEARDAVYRKVRNQVEEQLELHTSELNREVFRAVSKATLERH